MDKPGASHVCVLGRCILSSEVEGENNDIISSDAHYLADLRITECWTRLTYSYTPFVSSPSLVSPCYVLLQQLEAL